MLMQATTTTTTELNADKKEAGPVVVLAEVGRIGHDLARTSLYDNDTVPRRTWSPSCRIRYTSL